MVLSKLHALFCLCSCLTLVRFGWQDLHPAAQMKSSVWLNEIQALIAAASFGQTKIPRGSGSYSVGCTDLMFNYTKKGSFLRLYYPTQDDDHHDTLWIPNKEYFFGLTKVLGTHSIMAKFLGLLFGSMTTPAKWNSPLRTGEKYPLIVFSHGLGAFRTIYSAVGNDLASHGFIVAAVEHRDGSASATYYFEDQSAAMKGNKSWLYFKTLKRDEDEQIVCLFNILHMYNSVTLVMFITLFNHHHYPFPNIPITHHRSSVSPKQGVPLSPSLLSTPGN